MTINKLLSFNPESQILRVLEDGGDRAITCEEKPWGYFFVKILRRFGFFQSYALENIIDSLAKNYSDDVLASIYEKLETRGFIKWNSQEHTAFLKKISVLQKSKFSVPREQEDSPKLLSFNPESQILRVTGEEGGSVIRCEEKPWGYFFVKILRRFGFFQSYALENIIDSLAKNYSDDVLESIYKKLKTRGSIKWNSQEHTAFLKKISVLQKSKLTVPREQEDIPTELPRAVIMGHVRSGIMNEGNTCFANATIQAVVACTPRFKERVKEGEEEVENKFKQFVDSLMKGKTYVSGINELLTYLYKKPREAIEGDPIDFIYHLFPMLEKLHTLTSKGLGRDWNDIICTQKIQAITKSETTAQEIINGVFMKRQVLVYAALPTPIFILNLLGRRQGDGSYTPKIIKADLAVTLETDDPKIQKTYRMASVVMYATHHYYTLEPVYDVEGKLLEWISYNDRRVTHIPDTAAIRDTISKYGYLLFYKLTKAGP